MADQFPDYTPRDLPGGVYCSPGCGLGCSRTAFDEATAAAMQLAQRMGQGWEPDVWENLGWHYAVVNGPFKITFDERSQRYEAEYTLEANDGFVFQVFTDADLPEDAFGFAVQEIRTRLVRIEQSLREVGGEQ